MNIELLERLVESYNETCPELTYSNPLLDKNVTRALSKSFVKILNISKDNTNEKLRHAVLENIRNMCKIEPNQHINVDESLTELLVDCYERQMQDVNNPNNVDAIDKKLDAFLIRKTKEISIKSNYQSNMNPEVTQALLNLNERVTLKDLSTDVIQWNQDDKRCLKLLKEIWNSEMHNDTSTNMFDDTSIKIRTEIEKLLLDISYNLLYDNIKIEDQLTTNPYKTLIKTCAVSAECFQICISILNTLFLMNNFHCKIQNFIFIFVQKVKLACTKVTFAILYPIRLTPFVTLLDIHLDELPTLLRQSYVQLTIKYLQKLHKQSESDLILLFSHFPQWDKIYFEEKEEKN